ncbi:serine hydrolase domain-containing protein [Jannaschia aquimarina]|uniref:D-alanyl-D-alanine carboxypeptidase n=1 Tax=Jannaschia aquimarina TaxID=935700 RepID=A0A0D1EL00_9RHOB|nr:serine hydrolase domain-containing protein [Jannaschia aquimarina]KIT16410.1 D-alanyl-D-alanine carboxypeptidase precursor [Jannaschia aquimarina]SNS91598.1 CubicO group peptidase, beta-lactamase class C family [Jannaschia aquimarina]
MIRAALVSILLASPASAQKFLTPPPPAPTPVSSVAPAETDPHLQSVADELARHPAIPGAVVAVVTPDAIRTAVAGRRAAGFGGAPVRPGDRWHVGSLGKAMTATLAARLRDRGRLDWDATVGELLPAPGRFAAVTLEDLLTHRGGLPANLPGVLARSAPDRAFYVQAGLRMPLSRPAEGRFHYSNVGYVVAGAMMERATGLSWEDLMRIEVFGPLGMTGAGFGPPPRNQGHSAGPDPVAPGPAADNPAVMGPAGTIHLTAEDMAAFLQAHLTWDAGYLSPDGWERLHTAPPGQDYAAGWLFQEGRLTHNGSNTLWWAWMEIDHAAGRAIFVGVNAGDTRAVRMPIAEAVTALRTPPLEDVVTTRSR